MAASLALGGLLHKMIPGSVVILIFGVGGFVLFMAAVAHGSGQGAVFSLGLMGIAALGLFSKKRQQTSLSDKEITRVIKASQETVKHSAPTPSVERTMSPEQLAERLAGEIEAAFSSARFMELFKEQTFAEGWGLGDALAIWQSLGNLVLVLAVWQTYREQEKVFRIIDHCRSLLLANWKGSGSNRERLLAFVNETEGAAVRSYTHCKTGNDLSQFFTRYVSCISGYPIKFSEPSQHGTLIDILQGIEYGPADITTVATVSRIFVDTCNIVSTLVRSTQLDWNLAAPTKM